jgi:lambda repressor-like predicted transcriptional regulator
MKKYVKIIGMTAALALMVPLSAFAATNTAATTTTTTTQVKADSSGKQGNGMHGRGGGGGQFISDSVLTLLGLDKDALNEKLAAGSTLAEIAEEQGVKTDELKAALTAAFAERSSADEEQFTANLDKLINSDQLDQGRDHGKGHGLGFGHNSDTVATALSLTEDELQTELQAGKTIAAIAEDKGISTDTVIRSLETAINAQIDQAVTDGKLTQEEAAAKKENTAEQAQSIVNGEFSFKGDAGHRGGLKAKSDVSADSASTTETNA